MNQGAAFDPGSISAFHFVSRHIDPVTGQIELSYALDQQHFFTETFVLPLSQPIPEQRMAALQPALDLLHWLAGISYYKTACPSRLVFEQQRPGPAAAKLLTQVYRHGLGEFAWVNQLEQIMQLEFPDDGDEPEAARPLALSERSLLPVGGGKDSLLAGDLLLGANRAFDAVYVGGSPVIARSAASLGQTVLNIQRRLDPKLFELNERGAFNGHIPITAVLSGVIAVFAVAAGYSSVVLANEASADEGNQRTLAGVEVNHQWSKSLVFEQMFSDYLHQHVASDLDYFSLLRPYDEMAIIAAFANRPWLHADFTSCNRNFTIRALKQRRHWCLDCPKCRFVALGLATVLAPESVTEIMGGDLLDDPAQLDGMLGLLGLSAGKPFECVGTVAESRAALAQLASNPAWRNHRVVRQAFSALRSAGATMPELDELVNHRHAHRIPERFSGAMF